MQILHKNITYILSGAGTSPRSLLLLSEIARAYICIHMQTYANISNIHAAHEQLYDAKLSADAAASHDCAVRCQIKSGKFAHPMSQQHLYDTWHKDGPERGRQVTAAIAAQEKYLGRKIRALIEYERQHGVQVL